MLISGILKINNLKINVYRLVHTQTHIDKIREACEHLNDIASMENFCKGMEDVYINKYTWVIIERE